MLRHNQSFHSQKIPIYFLNSLYYASNPLYEDELPKVCRHFTGHQDKPPSPYIDITFEDSQVEAVRLGVILEIYVHTMGEI